MAPQPDLEPDLREMLRDVPPHDDWARRTTLEAIPSIRQRRWPWLPLRWPGGVSQRRTTTLSTLIASLLGVAVVGLLVGMPRTPAPTPGAAVPAPSHFSGLLLCGDIEDPRGSRVTRQFGPPDDRYSLSQRRGAGFTLEMAEVSDPRLDGSVVDYWEQDDYVDGLDRYSLGAGTWRLETEEGAWQGAFPNLELPADGWATTTFPMYGDGGYEGLVAIWELDARTDDRVGGCGWSVEGLIIDANLIPPPPGPPASQVPPATPPP